MLSAVSPKFPIEGQNLTQVPLMFTNSGGGSDLATLLGVTSRTSVFSSFIWNLLDNIRVLISYTHFSTQRIAETEAFTGYRIYIPVCHQHTTCDKLDD